TPDDAPPGWQEVVSLVQSARRSALPEELAGEQGLIAQVVAVVQARDGISNNLDKGRRPMFTSLRGLHLGKMIPVVAAVILGGSAVAAAATGSNGLAPAVQTRVSAHFGVVLSKNASAPLAVVH